MLYTKNYKRTAMVLSVIAGLVILWFTFQQVRGIYYTITTMSNILGDESLFQYSFFAVSFAGVPIMLASLIIGFSLLNSIRKDETPFLRKNVTKLKVVAILLIAFELYMLISQRIINTLFFRFADPNMTYVIEVSLGGVVVVLGLVVFCIALVFEYGISLQNQVDETL